MYTLNGKTISDEKAQASADYYGITVQEWADKYGWESGEGKPNGPAEKTPTVGPQPKSAGDSSSENTSLELQEIDFNITADDLAKDEYDVVQDLNKLLSRYGLIASQGTSFGSLDAINIKQRQSKSEDKNILEKIGSAPEAIFNAVADTFAAIQVGPDKSKEELEASAKEINKLVKSLGSKTYLNEAQETLGNKWQEFKDFSRPVEKTQAELKLDIEEARLDKFEKIDAKYKREADLRERNLSAGRNDNRRTYANQEDFKNEKEFNDYQAWLKGDVLSDITAEDIAAYDNDRKDSYMAAKATEFSSDLPVSERQAFDALIDNRMAVIEQDMVNYEKKFESAKKEGERVKALIESYKQNPSSTDYDVVMQAIDNLKAVEDDLVTTRENIAKESGDFKYLNHATSALKADYNRLRQMRTVFKGMGADVLYLGAQLDDMMGLAGDKEVEFAVGLGESIRKEQSGYQEDLTVEQAFDSSKNFGRWIAGASTNLLPSLGLAATGQAALPLFFMTGAGGRGMEFAIQEKEAAQRFAKNKKFLEENPNLEAEERAAIEQELEADSKILNIPEWKKLTTQAAYGLAEVAFERVGTLKIFDDIARAAKMLPAETIKEGAQRVATQYAKGFATEGGSEWATTVAGNIADIYLIGEDKNVFEGGLETFAQGALMGGGMTTINTPRIIKESIAGELATRKQEQRLSEIMDRISQLTGQNVQNIDAGALTAFGSSTPEVRKMVEELTLEADGIKDGILESLASGKYSSSDLFEIGEANREMRRINKEFSNAVMSGRFSESQLSAMEAEYRKKYDAAKARRNDILENDANIAENEAEFAKAKIDFDAQAGYVLYNTKMLTESKLKFNSQFDALSEASKQKLYKQAKAALGENADQAAVKQAARESFVENKFREAINNGIENARRFTEAFGEDMPAIETFDGETATQDYLNRLKELGYTASQLKEAKANLEAGITEAANIKRNGKEAILIHVPNSAKNGRIGVAAHEVLHAVARRRFKDANEAGKELLSYLEKNQPDLFARVKFRIDQSYSTKNVEGEIELDEDYYEEAMNAMSDVLADGFEVDGAALSKVREFINSLAPNILKLNSDEATYNFIRGFNKQAHFGGRGRGQSFQTPVITPDDKDSQKDSKTLLGDINALVPESVKTQADFFDRKVFNPIYNDGNLHPAIANYIRSRSVSQEEAQKIIESVADRLINFNPEATRKSGDAKITFGEFLFANVNFGKLDARKALFEESQERAQTESTDSEQARQIQSAETTTAQQAEAPTYKNLLERRVLAPEVVDAIRNKVKSTVRVMKTRMDQSVSKNVTVKPYIAEIKKAMGKQADIDLKKAMGGLKDGQFRKFLLKHKAAILQNMTTTYLMTAMPNAVQKSVNGQFTSDWKGKKIDREKVTTDNAGRTSGAELVRRLPNAATRLSDADFLSNFFTEDGKLIRGRKESLAKAMAEEISFDIINEALQDPNSEIRQAFEMRQDLLGVVLADNFVVNVSNDIERGSVKRSATVRGLSPAQRMVWEQGREALAARLAGVDQDYQAKYIKQDLRAVYGDEFTNKQYNDLAKDLYNMFKSIKKIDIEQEAVNKQDILEVLKEIDNDIDFNENVSKMTGASNSVSNLYRDRAKIAAAGEAIVEIIAKEKVPVEVAKTFLNKTFANSGRKGAFKPNGEVKENTRQDLFFNTEEVNSTFAGEGRPYTREEWDNAETLTSSASVQVNHLNGKFESSKELQEKDAQTAEAAWNLTNAIVKGLKGYDADIQAMVLAAMNSGTNTVARLAAPVTHIADGVQSTNVKQFRYEHATPARTVLALMYKHHVQGDNSIDLEALKNDYKVSIIPLSMDKVITSSGMAARQVYGYVPGKSNWYGRYYNLFTIGKVQFALRDMRTGEIIGEKYATAHKAKVEFNADRAAWEKAVSDIKDIESAKASQTTNAEELSNKFNEIIQKKKGVASYKEFSRIQAQLRGKKMGRFKFFIAPGADDFRGLVHYAFAGKGKDGEATMAFFEEKLMKPYFKGIAAIDAMRQQIKRDFKTVTKQFKDEYKMLSQQVGDSGFNYDHALRVYLWDRQGVEVEGLAKRDKKLLLDAIAKNPELVGLADALLVVARRDAWPDPVEYWEGGSVLADLNSMTEKIGRKAFLEEFIQNADAIFTEANLNKIEALYGRAHREAIEDSLYAMKNGTNRPSGANRQTNAWLNWINGSTGAIMFFNRRSALLQMLSFTNFINWSDNNPVKAAAAFANQKQYWKDFAMIFNSDKLKERRGGLKQDVSDSEIADVAGRSKNSPQAILAYLLKIGFTPTQIADSMAIATGGAMFYRNRVNTYLKQGMDQKAAEEQAFLDFSMKSDEAQQSSDPALVSQQQRSTLGRLILAFANTPMQYTRLMKKAGQDLINGRGNPVEHISKIAYYGVVQNFIFSALQSALFSLAFDDDEEDDERAKAKAEKKQVRVLNSMIDTVLRGSGIYGAVAATLKNTIMEYYSQEKKGFLADHTYTVLSAAGISPPIQSKLRKLYSAIQTKRFEKDNVAERGWALTADGKLNLGPNYSILGNVLSGLTNVPMDRVVDELKSISEALDARNKAWQRIALALGWKTWDVGVRNEEADLIKAAGKERRKREGIEKAKRTRAATNAAKKQQSSGTQFGPQRPGSSSAPQRRSNNNNRPSRTMGPPRP